MEEKKQSSIANGFSFGMITGGAMIILSLILFLLDQHMNRALTWTAYIVMIAGMIYGTLEYRKKSNGFLSYGQAFGSCFWIGLFAGILSTVYFVVFVQFIHPGFMNEMMDLTRQQMIESQPDMSEEQMEKALEISSAFMSMPAMAIMGLVSYAIGSSVFGLIIAIFLKKEDPSLKTL
jgi:hypothetical protein